MKKVLLALLIASLLISAVLIHLLKSGISLRTAPIIKPSVLSQDEKNLALGVSLRLSPDFLAADYVLWGVQPETPEIHQFLQMMQYEMEQLSKRPVHILANALEASPTDIQSCESPCWLLLPNTLAHELTANEFIEQRIRATNRPYFSVSWIPFQTKVQVPEHCLSQKRLTFECLKALSIHESQKKMTDPQGRYFFMRKYMDRDYFLFVQEQK